LRFYNLSISDPATGLIWKPDQTGLGFVKSAGGTTFSSLLSGYTNPAALQIEFDFQVVPLGQFQGYASIKVYGVGLGMIGQAANLNGANFQLFAGMALGLPLANPAQARLIAQGTIYQSYGNWEGPEQTLDLIVYSGSVANSQSVQFVWKKGQSLQQAIGSMLTAAFPSYQQSYNISSNLIAKSDQPGTYDSLPNVATAIQQLTQQIGRPIYGQNYSGVSITVSGRTVYVFDGQGPTPQSITQLAFQDLIGQPTWIEPFKISFKTVLRGDLQVTQNIQFPIGVTQPYVLTAATAAQPNTPASNKTAFQGAFQITEIHHWASFRQPQPESWNTTFVAVPLNP
jgi:hypothetical protein